MKRDSTISDWRPIGFKRVIDRIIVCVACNAVGMDIQPIHVLGKLKKPHYCRKHDVMDLPQYSAQDNAWMNQALF